MYANGRRISAQMLRRVWAGVTAHPQSTVRALASTLHLPNSTIVDTLHALRDAGYIDFPDKAERARQILVPFIVEERRHG